MGGLKIAAAISAAALTVALAACSSATQSPEQAASSLAQQSSDYSEAMREEGLSPGITYKVTSDAELAVVTYYTASGESQQTNVASPWTDTEQSVMLPILVAQTSGGTVSCEIDRDGVPIAQNTSTGPYTVVTCQPAVAFGG